MNRHTVDDLTRFVLTAVLGTVAIVAVAPFIRPDSLPPWLDGPSRGLRSHPAIANAADSLAHALSWQPPRSATPAPKTAAPAAQPIQDERWGIASVNDVPTYRLDGAFFKRFPSGTTVIILDSRESTAGAVYRCKLAPPDPGFDEFLIPAASLNVYEGILDTVPQASMELHQRYARLQADIKRAKRPAAGEVRKDNPYLAEYQKAKTSYEGFGITVRDLEKHFQKATGEERIRVGDELRSLRGKGVDLEQALAAARNRYESWNASHPSTDMVNNPEVKRLEAELAALESQMRKSSGTP